MKLIVKPTAHEGQFEISSDPSQWESGERWRETYVMLTGYTGPVKPETFAAAPQLLEALELLMPQRPNDLSANSYDLAMWEYAEQSIKKAKGEMP